jgi:hypothetical protein
MRFWFRELAGWALVLLGLFFFYLCLALLLQERSKILTAAPVALMGIFIFRGGIHFLKVAVAARICLHADKLARELDETRKVETPRKKLPTFGQR